MFIASMFIASTFIASTFIASTFVTSTFVTNATLIAYFFDFFPPDFFAVFTALTGSFFADFFFEDPLPEPDFPDEPLPKADDQF